MVRITVDPTASTEGLDVSRALRLTVSLLGAFFVAFIAGFAIFLLQVSTYRTHVPVEGDAVVVLTGGDSRIKDGLSLFNAGVGRRLLISGVHHSVTRQDLQRLSDSPQSLLFACCVDIGYRARDTIGNAEEARDWQQIWGFRRLVVVTSTDHMPRSMLEFRRSLPGVELVPFAVARHDRSADDWWPGSGSMKRMVLEYAKCWPAAARLALSLLLPGAQPTTLPALPASEVSSSQRQVTGL